jgi:hypothetical protein
MTYTVKRSGLWTNDFMRCALCCLTEIWLPVFTSFKATQADYDAYDRFTKSSIPTWEPAKVGKRTTIAFPLTPNRRNLLISRCKSNHRFQSWKKACKTDFFWSYILGLMYALFNSFAFFNVLLSLKSRMFMRGNIFWTTSSQHAAWPGLTSILWYCKKQNLLARSGMLKQVGITGCAQCVMSCTPQSLASLVPISYGVNSAHVKTNAAPTWTSP